MNRKQIVSNVLCDYKARFSKEEIKEHYYSVFLYAYLAILLRLLSSSTKEWLFFASFCLAAMIGMLLSRVCSNQLPTMMFLCPMDCNERKAYVKTGYWIRVAVPIIIYVTIVASLLMVKYIRGIDFTVGGIHSLLLSLSVNLYIPRSEEEKQNKKNTAGTRDGIYGWQAWTLVSVTVSIYYYQVLYWERAARKERYYEPVGITLFGILFSIMIASILYYVSKYYRESMNRAVENGEPYENRYSDKRNNGNL